LPHHYHATVNDLSFKPYTYTTARGTLQVAPGSTFHISWPFRGIAPVLPAPHTNNVPDDYQAGRMQQYVNAFAGGNRPGYVGDTYGQGKEFGVTATYLTMADQLGMSSAKSGLLTGMENLLDNWYTYTPGESAPYFGILPNWGGLIGLPESYGSGDFNDQHFHYGYYIIASALTGMEDPTWLQNYGPMITDVAKEYANWDRTDTSFPFMRTFDVWEGHSWAGGFSSPGGENQESSSEAMNGWVGLFMLGNMLGNQQMADAGAMGYTMESSAVNEYWQDWKHTNFPSSYGLYGCAILASQQIQYQNFFTAEPFWEYAIEYTPINSWNNYLTRDPYFIRDNLAAILPERAYAAANHLSGFTLSDANNDFSVQGNYPGDYVLAVQALTDPNTTAVELDNYWNANLDITSVKDLPGIVYYLTHSLRSLGTQDLTYYTNIPTSAVYYNASTGARTAVIYNPQSTALTATVYNASGSVTTVNVPARQLVTTSITGPTTNTPLPPTGLTATGTDGQVTVSWNAVSGATSYALYRVSSLGNHYFSGISGTSFTDTGLKNGGTSYTYQAYAVNAAGMSQPCTPVTVRLYGVGTQNIVDDLADLSLFSSQSPNWTIDSSNPQYFDQDVTRATRTADDTEYLIYSFPNISNFTARVYSLAGPITAVKFYASTDGGATFNQIAVNVGSKSTSTGWGYCDITPSSALPNGVTDLKIEFNSGSGNAWDPQLAKVAFTYVGPAGGSSSGPVPAAPTGLNVTAGNAQNSLAWNAVSGATSYNVYRATTPGGEGIVPLATRITSTSYMSDALANGLTYYYTVAAVNNGGVGPQSTEASATPTSGVTVPAAPAGLTATPLNHSATLSWTASTGASTYEVFRGTSAGGEGTSPLAGGLTGTTYTDTGLTNGTTYYYYVVAANAGGVSPASNEVNAVPNPPAEAPYGGTPWAVPGTVQAENYDTGGPGAAYNVTSTNGSANNYRTDGVDLEATTDTGGGYDLGWSAAGQWFNYTVKVAAAGTYTASFRVSSGASGGTLHIADLNGNNLSGPVSIPGTGGWQTWTTVTASVTLAAGTQVLQVYQDTGGYNINWMAFSNGTGAPAAPTGLTATAGNAQVALSWSSSTGATSYNVYRAAKSGGEGGTPYKTGISSTSYTDTGLTNGNTYFYEVTAVNSGGEGLASSEVNASPFASIPGEVAIDCAGPAVNQFVADTDFTGGTVAGMVTAPIDTSAVTNPAPQIVYQTERYGNMTYAIPGLTAGAAYTVRLHMCENYWTAAGQRKFNVSINGTQVLSNFDLFATAGAEHKAVVEQFTTNADASGNVTIQFTSVVDNALIDGIEIVPVPPAYTDVTGQVSITRGSVLPNFAGGGYYQNVSIKNTSAASIAGPVEMVITNLTSGVTVTNASGTFNGNPYRTATTSALAPGASVSVRINYSNPTNARFSYGVTVYSGPLK
jgi:fibronectin type 3 domain-containing protein